MENRCDHITIGILAHVDAGKTTLSEQLLYHAGVLQSVGRVDHGDSFLDTDDMEKSRGITIFSKEARLMAGDKELILLDTPGHVDFSAEMERTLSVMDYAILLVNAADGLSAHTEVLWKLLLERQIPVFVFVNKMDQFAADDGQGFDTDKKDEILKLLQKKLSAEILDFSLPYDCRGRDFWEEIAMTREDLLDDFLKAHDEEQEHFGDSLKPRTMGELVKSRRVFPCYFGSALKDKGIEEFWQEVLALVMPRSFPDEFGARIYRISRDDKGQRLLHLRLTGGRLSVRDTVSLSGGQRQQEKAGEEKITQLRLYSGSRYRTVSEIDAGQIAVVCGLSGGLSGEGIGYEQADLPPQMVPVLSYRLQGPGSVTVSELLEKLRILEEENPELSVRFEEEKSEIYIQLMGQVQTEVVKSRMEERFGIPVTLDEGEVIYRETIVGRVEGVGHFEPLRHYAEVHLLLEPAERGSGLSFKSRVSSDLLATNWKRLILQHLTEKQHRGVLTGAPLTDVRITLVAGRAHPKHTEGGDFRQATYRAVRQGLMQAENILLEPYYSVTVTLPTTMIGRVLTDLESMSGSGAPLTIGEENSVITGRAPVATIRNYAGELAAFTRGRGRLQLRFDGYDLCHNPEEVIAAKGYEPEHDLRNRSDSVFCMHGSSVIVPWDEVFSHMHLPPAEAVQKTDAGAVFGKAERTSVGPAGEDELKEIFERTFKSSWDGRRPEDENAPLFGKNSSLPVAGQRGQGDEKYRQKQKKNPVKEEILLVDGYNVMHADPELATLAGQNLDAARDSLLDILSDFQGTRDGKLVVVFDAYRITGGREHRQRYHNIEVVYTKEQQTADMYIEKTVHEAGSGVRIIVATSDRIEQIVSGGQGALLISSRELWRQIREKKQELRKEYL